MRAATTNWTKALPLIAIGIAIGVAMPGVQPSIAKEVKKVEPPRTGYVNVVKVLRDYNRADLAQAKISRLREEYVNKVNADREGIRNINEQFRATTDLQLKKALQEQALTIQRRIEDTDKEAQVTLTRLSNNSIAAAFDEIRTVIAELARDRGLDVVEGFPGSATPKDETSPQLAQQMLQTPALIPYYIKPELDFTEDVIERLNKKYPPEKEGSPAK